MRPKSHFTACAFLFYVTGQKEGFTLCQTKNKYIHIHMRVYIYLCERADRGLLGKVIVLFCVSVVDSAVLIVVFVLIVTVAIRQNGDLLYIPTLRSLPLLSLMC